MNAPTCACGWATENLEFEDNRIDGVPEWRTKNYETSHGFGLACKFCPQCGDVITPSAIDVKK